MTNSTIAAGFRAGRVVLVGRPNAGKSSLVNRLLDFKAAIVSDKPQTTRNAIRCIYNGDGCQIVFVDTPGIHLPKLKLGRALVNAALDALNGSDLVCYLVEAQDREIGPEDAEIISVLAKSSTPVLLVVNKCDLANSRSVREPEACARVRELYGRSVDLEGVVCVSARTGAGLDALLKAIVPCLPEGPPFYDEDMIVDVPEKFLASEIIREKALALTHREVPHSIAVEVEDYKSPDEYPDRDVLYVRANIFVEREGQRRIVIGAGGDRLKEIGRLSRIDIEALTGHRAYLDLWVKVRKNWRQSEADLRAFGIEERAPRGDKAR